MHYTHDPNDTSSLCNHYYREGEAPDPADGEVISSVRAHYKRNPISRVINTINGNLKMNGRLNRGVHPDAWKIDENGKPHHTGI